MHQDDKTLLDTALEAVGDFMSTLGISLLGVLMIVLAVLQMIYNPAFLTLIVCLLMIWGGLHFIMYGYEQYRDLKEYKEYRKENEDH